MEVRPELESDEVMRLRVDRVRAVEVVGVVVWVARRDDHALGLAEVAAARYDTNKMLDTAIS